MRVPAPTRGTHGRSLGPSGGWTQPLSSPGGRSPRGRPGNLAPQSLLEARPHRQALPAASLPSGRARGFTTVSTVDNDTKLPRTLDMAQWTEVTGMMGGRHPSLPAPPSASSTRTDPAASASHPVRIHPSRGQRGLSPDNRTCLFPACGRGPLLTTGKSLTYFQQGGWTLPRLASMRRTGQRGTEQTSAQPHVL